MNTYLLIWFFVVGCVLGSFYGVVGGRLPEGKSIIKPRSHCSKCKHVLSWYELIPIFSYVIQKGKCRNCKANISILYPIIELINGLLFSISFFCFGFSRELIIALIIVSFFTIVVVSDINYLIIPDEVTIFFCILTIIVKFIFFPLNNTLGSIFSGIIMFTVMYCIMIIGGKIFKKECLGGADVKLMGFVGLIVSPSLGILTIFLSSCIALPVSIYILIKNKNNVIPFGPYILLATYLIYSFGISYSFFHLI